MIGHFRLMKVKNINLKDFFEPFELINSFMVVLIIDFIIIKRGVFDNNHCFIVIINITVIIITIVIIKTIIIITIVVIVIINYHCYWILDSLFIITFKKLLRIV